MPQTEALTPLLFRPRGFLPMKSCMRERRRSPRQRLSGYPRVVLAEQDAEAWMVDLSQMGVLLTANLRVEPGSVLHLRVVGADESVELEVECRWTRASEHLGAFDLGMEFLRPDPDAIRRLFAIHDQAPALAAS